MKIINRRIKRLNDLMRRTNDAPRIKAEYPVGTRVLLIQMNDPFAPVPAGMRGTVRHVDDAGQIHMSWDNGRGLALIDGEDSFRKLTDEEIAQELSEQAQETGMNMGM